VDNFLCNIAIELQMKKTPFYNFHLELNAKIESFAGYQMPIQYTGIKDEHMAVRNKLGVFDVSHMGEFWVRGPKAFELVQFVTSNDVSALRDGKVQYSCFPNGKGGIVDDLLVYRFSDENYLLVVNAANIEKDWNWCVTHAEKMGLKIGTELINASDDTAQLAIQGPLALKVMQTLTDDVVEDMEYYTFKEIPFAGIPKVLFSTTGYTGSGGCEIYVDNKYAVQLWKAVMEAGAEYGIQAIGLGARDTLRLEMGYCLYGNDISDSTSPIEAGLAWITKFSDGNNFIDRELLEKQKSDKPSRRLRGFIMKERGIPRHDYKILNSEGVVIGVITSGTMSPALGVGIGMGYIASEFAGFGKEIFIEIRNKSVKAEIVKLPFYKA